LDNGAHLVVVFTERVPLRYVIEFVETAGRVAGIVERERGTTRGKIAVFEKVGICVAECFAGMMSILRQVLETN